MGVAVQLLNDLKKVIDRRVAEGRTSSEAAFLEEAVRRYAVELELEDQIVAVAQAGIADAEQGRFKTVSTPEEADAFCDGVMDRVRARLSSEKGKRSTVTSASRKTASTWLFLRAPECMDRGALAATCG